MDSVGLIAVVAVLVVGLAVGMWRRRTDGRLVAVGRAGRQSHLTRETAGAATAAQATARAATAAPATADTVTSTEAPAGAATSPPAPAGTVTSAEGTVGGLGAAADDERLDAGLLHRLGVGPAEATLLQFSSAFCAPCRAVRRVSTEVAGLLPGVQHIEVDAESHLDEVRALNIWRTPTLLVLDGDGRVTRRATGVPTKPQLIAALGEVLSAAG